MRIQRGTRKELKDSIFFILPPQVGDRIIELFAESESFGEANSFSFIVAKYYIDYTKDQIKRIIEVCGENSQIKESFEIGTVINAMRRNKHVTDDEINSWLIEADLKTYVKSKTELED